MEDRPWWRSYVSVLLVFGVLASSGDLLSAGRDLVSVLGGDLDGLALAAISLGLDMLLIALLWLTRETGRDWAVPSGAAWVMVGVVFIAIDIGRSFVAELSTLADIASLFLYLPLLAVLFAYSRGHHVAGPLVRLLLADDREPGDAELFQTVLPAVPLLLGAAAAWTASVLWVDEFDLREETGIDAGVSPEFFAQVSQVIPVLLLALLFEARLLRVRRGSTRSALSVYVVGALVIAECLVLSTLPMSNDPDEGNEILLTDWHEYLALGVAAYAVVVALTALVVLVAGGLEQEQEPLPVKVVA